jgi:hypothetical protein
MAVLTGCGREPRLEDAAHRLESDARWVLDDGAERLGAPGVPPVLRTGTDRRCGGGRAERVVHGEVRLRPGGSTDVTLDHAGDVTLGSIQERGYRLERPPTARDRTFTMVQEASETRITVRLRGGARPTLTLEGVTPCLPG